MEKSALAGTPAVLVDPRSTSRTGPRCGRIGQRNRPCSLAITIPTELERPWANGPLVASAPLAQWDTRDAPESTSRAGGTSRDRPS